MRYLYIINTFELGLAPLYVGETHNVAGRVRTHERRTEHGEWWGHVAPNRIEVIDLGDVTKEAAEDAERKLIAAARPYANRADNPRWFGDRTVQAMTKLQFNRMVNQLIHADRLDAQLSQTMAIWTANQLTADAVDLAARGQRHRSRRVPAVRAA